MQRKLESRLQLQQHGQDCTCGWVAGPRQPPQFSQLPQLADHSRHPLNLSTVLAAAQSLPCALAAAEPALAQGRSITARGSCPR